METANHLYSCNWEGDHNIHSSTINNNVHRMKMKFLKQKSNLMEKPLKAHVTLGNYVFPANKNFRQNLQIMIMCSQRPVKITALKFSTLSLQSFTAILSTSMSYFTLLQTVYDENAQKE